MSSITFFIIINIALIIIIISELLTEVKDVRRINQYYDDHLKSNKEVIQYLEMLYDKPTWRVSLFLAVMISAFSTICIYFAGVNYKIKPEHYFVIYMFIVLFSYTIIQKYLTHYTWHVLMPAPKSVY